MLLFEKQTAEDRIRQVADRLEPDVRRAFLSAVEALKRNVPVNDIADLLDAGRLTEALERLSQVDLPDLSGLRDAIAEAATTTAEDIAVNFGMEFAAVNEQAVRWAQTHAARLVTGVNNETRQAIRDIVVRGQREGINVRDQAQLIRRIIGLTDRDARAVDRFFMGLLEDDVRNPQTQADRMAARLLRRRAETIAQTETMRAANRGVQVGWERAQEQGLLPGSTQKVWIATADSRTCPICAVLDGQVIGLRDDFDISEQATSFEREGQTFRVVDTKPLRRPTVERTPPAHPKCRCTSGLEFGGEVSVPSPGEFQSREDAEQFLRSLGIQDVDLDGINNIESLNQIGEGINRIAERYPWVKDSFGTPNGLNRVVTNIDRLEHFSAAAQVRGASNGIEMALNPNVFNDDFLFDMLSAGDHSPLSTVIHEMGHVAHRTLSHRVMTEGLSSRFLPTVSMTELELHGPWRTLKNPRKALLRELSMYADENGDELFGEMFNIKNLFGYEDHLNNAYWRREGAPKAAVERLKAAERFIEDRLAPWVKKLGIAPEDIL